MNPQRAAADDPQHLAIEPRIDHVPRRPAVAVADPQMPPPAVHIRIGTVEVRADVPAPAAEAAPPAAPVGAQGFDDFRRVRTHLAWGG